MDRLQAELVNRIRWTFGVFLAGGRRVFAPCIRDIDSFPDFQEKRLLYTAQRLCDMDPSLLSHLSPDEFVNLMGMSLPEDTVYVETRMLDSSNQAPVTVNPEGRFLLSPGEYTLSMSFIDHHCDPLQQQDVFAVQVSLNQVPCAGVQCQYNIPNKATDVMVPLVVEPPDPQREEDLDMRTFTLQVARKREGQLHQQVLARPLVLHAFVFQDPSCVQAESNLVHKRVQEQYSSTPSHTPPNNLHKFQGRCLFTHRTLLPWQ